MTFPHPIDMGQFINIDFNGPENTISLKIGDNTKAHDYPHKPSLRKTS